MIQTMTLTDTDIEVLENLPIFVHDVTDHARKIEALENLLEMATRYEPDAENIEAVADAIEELKELARADADEVEAGITILRKVGTEDARTEAERLTELLSDMKGKFE